MIIKTDNNNINKSVYAEVLITQRMMLKVSDGNGNYCDHKIILMLLLIKVVKILNTILNYCGEWWVWYWQ